VRLAAFFFLTRRCFAAFDGDLLGVRFDFAFGDDFFAGFAMGLGLPRSSVGRKSFVGDFMISIMMRREMPCNEPTLLLSI